MEQFKVAVPRSERVNGYLYDYHSGICMGVASDEMKAKYPIGKQPFSMDISGCPHKLIIHAKLGREHIGVDGFFSCEFCRCYTNAKFRGCCDDGRAKDRAFIEDGT